MIIRRNGGIPRRGCLNRHNMDNKGNDTCHKCGKHGHFIKYCPLHKIEYKEYVKNVGDREKTKDRVPNRYNRRVVDDRVV